MDALAFNETFFFSASLQIMMEKNAKDMIKSSRETWNFRQLEMNSMKLEWNDLNSLIRNCIRKVK